MSQLTSSPARPEPTQETGAGGRPDRPTVRARSGRRPLPPLAFLLVLAVAAAPSVAGPLLELLERLHPAE